MNLQAKAEKNNYKLLSKPSILLSGQGLSGIYIHVPFCASTCDFCAFYQQKPHRPDLETYLEGLKKDFNLRLPKGPVETVFMGGGTPGLLPAKDLQFIGNELMKYIETKPKEWSVEMAPSTVKMDKLLAMKDIGVNRISMGVQSFNEERLKSLGRLHSPKQVYKAYDCIRKAGFDNVNLDMMFALPGQDLLGLEEDLNEAIQLNPEHISTYCLTFEEDTALYIKLSQGKVKINEENEHAMYIKTWNLLEENGYAQYEISNFARPGHECLHNINTWKMKTWLGFGPSGASQYRMERYANPSSQKEWIEGINANTPKRVEEVALNENMLAEDSLIFGLRMNSGVDLDEWKVSYPNVKFQKYADLFDRLVKNSLCEYSESKIRLTKTGRLVADSIAELIM